jgi:hypothetical protein
LTGGYILLVGDAEFDASPVSGFFFTVAWIGYQILEKDGRLVEVESGRQGVSGRIDVICRETNAILWGLRYF